MNARGAIIVRVPRLKPSCTFAAAFAGATVIDMPPNDDLAPIWFGHLKGAVERRADCVAGVTQESHRFMIERLAWSVGAKLISVGFHDGRSNGSIVHELMLPEGEVSAASALQQAGAEWPTVVAAVIGRWNGHADLRQFKTDSPMAAPCEADTRYLTSWLIV
jgi:hypothetical protein